MPRTLAAFALLLLLSSPAAGEGSLRVRVGSPAKPFDVEGVFRGGAGVHKVRPSGGWLTLGAAKKRYERLRIDPKRGGFVRFGGRRYRGALEIVATPGGATVVNVVPLESYLKGVLPAEIGGKSPPAAQKAQAAVARSYAIATRGKHAKAGYDLCDGTCCQVYRGFDVETAEAREAVDATRGAILHFSGAPFTPFYHASCGGRTATPEEAWAGGRPNPALSSVKCSVCAKGAPRWTYKIDARTLAKKLTAGGYRLQQVRRIEVLNRSGSGRIDALMIFGRGESVIVSGFALRRILGAEAVKSTRFDVEVGGDGGGDAGEGGDSIGRVIARTIGRVIRGSRSALTVTFRGRGYGHGVGLCQEGAIGLAKAGRSWKTILKTYFPGSRLVKWE